MLTFHVQGTFTNGHHLLKRHFPITAIFSFPKCCFTIYLFNLSITTNFVFSRVAILESSYCNNHYLVLWEGYACDCGFLRISYLFFVNWRPMNTYILCYLSKSLWCGKSEWHLQYMFVENKNTRSYLNTSIFWFHPY